MKAILRRLTVALLAITTLMVSAALCLTALAFALYALLAPHLGAPGAAAAVAGVAAVLMGLGALVLSLSVKTPRAKPVVNNASGVIERILGFVREKPVIAIAGAIGAGLLAIRNPNYLGAAVRSFLEGREGRKR